MLIAFDDGSAVHELEVVVHDPDATVADLVRALDPVHPHRSLEIDGVHRPADRRLDRAAITAGSTVTLTDEPCADPPTDLRPAATLRVAGGLAAGEWSELRTARVTVGRGTPLAGLQSTTVSAVHAELTLDRAGLVTVTDRASRNGTWLDGHQVMVPTPVPPGSVLRLGASHLVAAAPVDDRPTALAVDRTTGPATVPFNRPPRPTRPTAGEPVMPPAAPETRAPPHPVGVVSVLAPIVMGLVMVMVFDSLLFGLFALLSPVVLLGTTLENRRRGRRGGRRDRQRYDRELAAFREALGARAGMARARLVEALPDPAEVVRRAITPSTRLWERRRDHPDALHLRLGIGPVLWDPPVSGEPGQHPAEVRAAIDDANRLLDAPVVLDLSAGAVVGLVGHRTAALAVARSLLVQAATHHGPADLGVAIVVSPDHAADWDWAKWLPHTLDPGGSGGRRLTADHEGADRLFRAMLDDGADAPFLVVLDDEALTEGRRAPARSVLRRNGVAGIVVASTDDRLPAVCSTVIELRDGDGTARVHRVDRGEVVDDVLAAGVTDATARRAARALARFEDPELEVSGAGLPATVGLLPLLGLDPPTPDGLLARWAAGGADPDLLAPLGVAEDGVLAVDLVRDGPHALVAGTTGAGKSELLRTLVAGLATACSPDHVTFVLVDFKGGSVFDRCAGLPHTVGLVTDLDAHLAQRALRCLEAELRHRERILRAAGAADLTEHRRRADRSQPLPRLVVVVDEFATLKAELPDFVESLVGVAQRGRSLGVHLVLATQRPSGAVSENIRANTNLRIALRVQDPADSTDVIDRPDAARIGRNQPGRAFVRLGPAEVEPLQTALATGVATGGHEAVLVRPFRFGAGPASVATAEPFTGSAGADTDLQRLVDAAIEAHRRSGRPAPRRPWPDPLPAEVDLDGLAAPGRGPAFGAPGMVVPVALADDPDAQARYPVGWVPSDGNLLLLGIRGSGTTTACGSLVVALARRERPGDLHVHVLDMGAGELAPLAALPHVGSVVTAAERERQARLVRWLRAELDRRRAGPPGDSAGPRIVVVLDGVAAFRAEWEDSLHGVWEDLQRVFADGPEVGVHAVVSADRAGALPGAMQSVARQRWLFRTADALERSAFGLRAGDVPDLGPGRAVVAERAQEIQVARPAGGLDAGVARLAATVADPGPGRRPVAVGVLPHDVDPADLVGGVRVAGQPWTIPVGIADATLGPAALVLHEGEHALVAGPSRSGRTSLLAAVAWLVRTAAPEATIVAVAGGRSALAGAGAVGRVLAPDALLGALEEACAPAGPVLVLVDDADLVDDDDGALAGLLSARRPDLHVVAAGRNEALRSRYGHWTRALRAARAAVLLQPDPDLDGDLAGTTLPRRSIVALTPGRGYLVCEGRLDVVQTTALHERH